ncbi:MAG TPA: SDR family oxidoreductase [Thermohalobaculum sp.]|nr:SDR family oxidoreductase [Thermohalobaculum sp.]
MAGTALVTGGAIRLGRTIARRLAAEGFGIACHYRGSADDARSLAAEIEDAGGTCRLFQADLAEPGAADALFDRVEAGMGAPTLLVNNASRFSNDAADRFDEEGLAAHMAVNLAAPVGLARRLHQAAEDGGDRLIVNMLDAKLFQLTPDFFTYTLSKYALLGATRTMAIGYAPAVRVVGIAPSITLISGKQNEESFQRSKRLTLLGRGPEPDEIAEAVLFAWRTKSMTGEVLTLDGGQRLMNLPRDTAYYVKVGLP